MRCAFIGNPLQVRCGLFLPFPDNPILEWWKKWWVWAYGLFRRMESVKLDVVGMV